MESNGRIYPESKEELNKKWQELIDKYTTNLPALLEEINHPEKLTIIERIKSLFKK